VPGNVAVGVFFEALRDVGACLRQSVENVNGLVVEAMNV
jgi:hypothetical protein